MSRVDWSLRWLARSLGVLALLVTLILPWPCIAQSGGSSAPQVIARAIQDARNRNYRGAVEGFKKAWKLTGDPDHLFNVATLYLLRLSEPLTAWDYAGQYRDAVASDTGKREAADLLSKVETVLFKSHGKIVLAVAPDAAELWLDRRLPEARFTGPILWVSSGRHAILAEAPGFRPYTKIVRIDPGETLLVRAELVPVPKESEPVKKVFEAPPGDGKPVAGRALTAGRIGSWVSMGTGTAMVVAGAVLYGLAYQDYQDAGDLEPGPGYDAAFDSKIGNGRNKAYASYGLLGAGAAALGVGLVLYFVMPADRPVTLVPSGLDGPGIAAHIRW